MKMSKSKMSNENFQDRKFRFWKFPLKKIEISKNQKTHIKKGMFKQNYQNDRSTKYRF